MRREDIAILIPAYKPDEKLIKLVDELLKFKYNVVIVNDGSGNEYDNIFNSLHDVHLLSHQVNKGKGAALKTGISFIAQNNKYTHIITADADGQHTPEDINKLADFLLETNESFVIGSRKFTGDIPFRSKFGNQMTKGAYALASGVKISDTQTGLRGFSKELFAKLVQIKGDRYEYEINVLLYVAKNKIKINEISIETIYINENASSHFHPIKDSAKIYSCILKYCFSSFASLIKYCISSFASFVVDFIFAHLFLWLLGMMLGNDSYVLFEKFHFTGAAATAALAPALARVISSIFNFLLNKKIVFNSKEKTSTTAKKYFPLVAFVLILNSVFIVILEKFIGNFTIAYVITQAALFIMNYIIQKKFVFKAD